MLNNLYQKFLDLINSPVLLSNFFDNRFYLILLVVVLMRLKTSTYQNIWLSAIINIPGTILHEIMHFVVGLVLNAQPCNFSIFPKKNNNGDYVMGSVSFRNITFYNAIPAAMAPLLLLAIGFYINRYVLPLIPANLLNYIIYVLAQTIIIENAIPSRADFCVATKFFSGIVLYTALLVAIILI